MNYSQALDYLDKIGKNDSFSEDDVYVINRIAKSSNNENKFRLLEIIQEHTMQAEIYKVIKNLAENSCDYVNKMAIQILSTCHDQNTYIFLLELAQKGNKKQRFFALYYLRVLVYEMDLDEELWMKDIEKATINYTDKMTKFIMTVSYFFGTWDLKYLREIERGLYNSSLFLRIWTVNILEDILDLLDPGDEEIDIIRQILYTKMQRKDRIRKVRILVDQAYCRISREFDAAEFCERDFEEEFEAAQKYECRIKETAKTEDILSYAILLFYYPFCDIEKAIKLLKKYYKEKDERLAILGSYYSCYYVYEGKKEIGNPFLDYLMETISQYDAQEKALILMMKGVTLILQKKKEEGMKVLKNAICEDANCANIYKEIADISLPYSKKHKMAKKKFLNLQNKITIDELEKIPLNKRCQYSFFLEMEIKKNIRKPKGFE